MDGLHRLTTAAWELPINGRTYKLTPPTLKDYGEIETHLLSQRPSPLRIAAETLPTLGLSPAREAMLIGKALEQEAKARIQRVEQAEINHYLNTNEGICYFFWLTLRPENPDFDSLEKATELANSYVGEHKQLLAALLDKVSGATELKKSQPPVEPVGATTESTGLESAASSA